jgi:beta-glucosidase
VEETSNTILKTPLTGKIAASIINGIQSMVLLLLSILQLIIKKQIECVNAHISERAMREILRGFEITVKESQPWTMSSYNLINGTYTSERKDLLTTILRENGDSKD